MTNVTKTKTHFAQKTLAKTKSEAAAKSNTVGEVQKKLRLCTAASSRPGARVREELAHHLLLVPPGPGHLRQHLGQRRPQLEDDPGLAGRLDAGLPGHDQGHPVVGEGKAAPVRPSARGV